MAARKYGEGKTPIRTLRAEDHEWVPFGRAAKRAGTDRTSLLRQFMRWYSGQPGAEMPHRPEPTETS
jgi:hypothetical protein